MPAWVWWLLAALVVAGVIAVPLLVRSQRRRRWVTALREAEQQVEWFARTLVPDLRSAGSAEAIRGAWTVTEGRVLTTEDQLTALAASAPDATGRDRATALRDGVRGARVRIQTVIGSGTSDATGEMDAVVAGLEGVLAPAPDTSPPAA